MSRFRNSTRTSASSGISLANDLSVTTNFPINQSLAGRRCLRNEVGYNADSLARKTAFKWLRYYLRRKAAKRWVLPSIVKIEHVEEIYSQEYVQPPEQRVSKVSRPSLESEPLVRNYLLNHSATPSRSFSPRSDVMSPNEREQLNERINNLQNELKTVKDERNSFENNAADSSRKIKNAQKEAEMLTKENLDCQQRMGNLISENRRLTDTIEAINTTKGGLHEQIGKLEKELKAVKSEWNGLEDHCAESNRRLENAQAEVRSLTKENLDCQQKINQLLADNSSLNDDIVATKNGFNEEIQTLINELKAGEDERNHLENEGVEKNRKIETLQNEAQLLTVEKLDCQERIDQLQADYNGLNDALNKTKDGLNEQIRNLKDELKAIDGERNKLLKEFDESNKKLENVQAEALLLTQENQACKNRINQLMADNINLTEATNATKNSLNDQIMNVENELRTAKEARNSLENESNRKLENAQKEAHLLAKENQNCQQKINQLLANNTSLNDAINGNKNVYEEKLRNLENELRSAKGENESLVNQCNESNQKLENAQKEVQSLKNENLDYHQTIGQLMIDYDNLSETINATKNGLNEQIMILENELKTLRDERNSLENQCTENNKRIESAQGKIQSLTNENQGFQQRIGQLLEEGKSLKDGQAILIEQVKHLENELKSVKDEKDSSENKCAESIRRAADAEMEIQSLANVNMDCQRRFSHLSAENKSLNDAIEATRVVLNEKIDDLEYELKKTKEERDSFEKNCAESTRQAKNLENEVHLLTTENMDWHQKIGQLFLDNKNLKNELKTTKDLLERERQRPCTSGARAYTQSDSVLVWRMMSTLNELEDTSVPVLTSITLASTNNAPILHDFHDSDATLANWSSIFDEEVPDDEAEDPEVLQELMSNTSSSMGSDSTASTLWTSSPYSLNTISSTVLSMTTSNSGDSDLGLTSSVSRLPPNQFTDIMEALRHFALRLAYPFFHWFVLPIFHWFRLSFNRLMLLWRPDDDAN